MITKQSALTVAILSALLICEPANASEMTEQFATSLSEHNARQTEERLSASNISSDNILVDAATGNVTISVDASALKNMTAEQAYADMNLVANELQTAMVATPLFATKPDLQELFAPSAKSWGTCASKIASCAAGAAMVYRYGGCAAALGAWVGGPVTEAIAAGFCVAALTEETWSCSSGIADCIDAGIKRQTTTVRARTRHLTAHGGSSGGEPQAYSCPDNVQYARGIQWAVNSKGVVTQIGVYCSGSSSVNRSFGSATGATLNNFTCGTGRLIVGWKTKISNGRITAILPACGRVTGTRNVEYSGKQALFDSAPGTVSTQLCPTVTHAGSHEKVGRIQVTPVLSGVGFQSVRLTCH